jgi:hypothetical protein
LPTHPGRCQRRCQSHPADAATGKWESRPRERTCDLWLRRLNPPRNDGERCDREPRNDGGSRGPRFAPLPAVAQSGATTVLQRAAAAASGRSTWPASRTIGSSCWRSMTAGSITTRSTLRSAESRAGRGLSGSLSPWRACGPSLIRGCRGALRRRAPRRSPTSPGVKSLSHGPMPLNSCRLPPVP